MTKQKTWILIGLLTLAILIITIKLNVMFDGEIKTPLEPKQTIVQETALNTVYIKDDAYRKLGIQVAPIKRRATTDSKTYGAEIVVPSGGLISISAPITGKLIPVDKTQLTPGARVKSGQLLYRIQPMITADARANLVNALADAESLVNVSKSQVEATEIALNRAKKLLQDLVGSQRNVDDANAAHEIALRNMEAAYAKRNALRQVVNLGSVEAIDIKSPQAGIVSNVFAASSQLVSAGNPIIQISELDSLWVRVPVPSSDLGMIDQKADASLQPLSSASKEPTLLAKPINAPPTADPLTSATHLYYVLKNVDSTWRPMQRISVMLNTLSKTDNKLTIPYSAVVYDIYGGSWVYMQQSKNSYERKRVFLDHVSGKQAIISEGPAENSQIVINGALELFAVETGFAH